MTSPVSLARPSFILSPAPASALRRLAEINAAAFSTDPLRIAAFHDVSDDAYTHWVAANLAHHPPPPGMEVVVIQAARADTGELVGYSRWYYPAPAAAGTDVPGPVEDADGLPSGTVPLPDGTDIEGYASHKRISKAAQKRLLPERAHYSRFALLRPHYSAQRMHTVLSFLAVDPMAQRMGVGTALVRWGIERADEAGLPIYVSASLIAAPLYERLGWQTKDLSTVRYTNGMEVVVTHMVREPRGRLSA
jgi:GNAT superfamily N-acetyltransferase